MLMHWPLNVFILCTRAMVDGKIIGTTEFRIFWKNKSVMEALICIDLFKHIDLQQHITYYETISWFSWIDRLLFFIYPFFSYRQKY